MSTALFPTAIAAELYWSLPGPSDFVHRIARAAMESPMVFINTPRRQIPGTWEHVIRGLKDAQIEAPVEIRVTDGNDIAAEIGFHLGERRVSADKLASLHTHFRSAFVLRPEDTEEAYNNASQYAAEYLNANPGQPGNVVLVIGLSNEEFTSDQNRDEFRIVAFDGGLTHDEMEAYVNLRMIKKPGPGSTRLTRAIVCEYAGFDVQFAEMLMALDEATLVAIQEHLPELASQFGDRGRRCTWLEGMSSLSQPDVTHVLHEFYASRHGQPAQRFIMEKRLKARYFRATVKTLTPWLETNRDEVLTVFKPKINQIAEKNGGVIKIPTSKGRYRDADPDALEYNNILGLQREGDLVVTGDEEQKAFDVCLAAVRVRNEIAHLRPPAASDIVNLVRKMDAMLA